MRPAAVWFATLSAAILAAAARAEADVVVLTESGEPPLGTGHVGARRDVMNEPEDLDHDGRLGPGDLDGVDQDGNGFADDVVGWDFADDDPDPGDTHGHGSAVSACVSAATDNGLRLAALGFGVRLMALRAISGGGVGATDAMPFAAHTEAAPRLRCAPSPFDAATVVRFDLDRPGPIDLAVFDVRGRRVARLDRGWRDAGPHAIVWAPDALPSGVYFVRLTGSGAPAARAISLVR